MLFRKSAWFFFLILTCFLVNCVSTEDSRSKRTRKKRRVKVERSKNLRDPASNKNALFFDESGLDFLSEKLEDTISGYEGLQKKISGLEDRLSRLIFLLEEKIQASSKNKKNEYPEEEEIDDLPTESEEVFLGDSEKETIKDKPQQKIPDLPNESVVSKGT